MKKKNNRTPGNKSHNNATGFFTRRPNRTIAQQNNISKYFGDNSNAPHEEGNIYGESEEDYYSHP